MVATHMYNLILTAEETQLKGNFHSVIILCGFAALILLIVAGKLLYDRFIVPKIDEIEFGTPQNKKKKKKKVNNTNNVNKQKTKTDNSNTEATDDSEDDEGDFAFEYASIEDNDDADSKGEVS